MGSTDAPDVMQWLRDVYGDSPIPTFDDQLLSHPSLSLLCQKNQARQNRHALLCTYTRERIKQYRELQSRTAKVNHSLGVALHMLSNEAQALVRSMASLAVTLGLQSTDDASYLLALNELERVRHSIDSDAQEPDDLYNQTSQLTHDDSLFVRVSALLKGGEGVAMNQREQGLIELTKHALRELHAAKRLSQRLESEKCVDEDRLSGISNQLPMWQAKGFQYKEETRQLTKALDANAFKEAITHEALVKDFERIQQDKRSLAALRKELKRFHKIPADEGLAALQVSEARQKLTNLQKRFDESISDIQY